MKMLRSLSKARNKVKTIMTHLLIKTSTLIQKEGKLRIQKCGKCNMTLNKVKNLNKLGCHFESINLYKNKK